MTLKRLFIVLKMLILALVLFPLRFIFGRYFFLSVDTECKFIDKVYIDKNSYELHFYDGSMQIAELCDLFNCKACLFIDYPEIEIFKNHAKSSLGLLKKLYERGHSIQLHLHPALINPERSPDVSFYSETRIIDMLEEGKNIIYSVIGRKPHIFRAGGYSVGNWKKIYSALVGSRFLIDSSTFSGANNLHKAKFDFKGIENMYPYYPSPYDIKKKQENEIFQKQYKNGVIIEFPITTAIKCSNNNDADFFKFTATNKFIYLVIFTLYLCAIHRNVIINMMIHSKEVYDNDGSLSKAFYTLKDFLQFIRRIGFISGNWDDVTFLKGKIITSFSS